MKSCVPSLTTDGFVKNKRMIFYKVWEYFLASEYSQSNSYSGDIASLKWIIGTNSSNIVIVDKTEEHLKKLFKKYFDDVEVDCFIVNEKEAFRTMSIAITCKDDEDPDITYTLVKDVQYQKGEIKNYEQLLVELYQHYTTD